MKKRSKMHKRMRQVQENKRLIYGDNAPSQAERQHAAVVDYHRPKQRASLLVTVSEYYSSMRVRHGVIVSGLAALGLAWRMVRA